MHKILILGHPSSQFEQLAVLLHSFGMQEAKPSRREGFLPAEITQTICQAHGINQHSTSELEPDFSQLDVGNVWHGMALDLMLGNLEAEIWGWADTKSIYLLNYWRDLDPEITFVLAYSSPEDVLLNNQYSSELTADDLETKIQHWIAYNDALLHFYNRNKERCFLLHTEQVDAASNRCLLEIGTRINAPWLDQLSNNQLEHYLEPQNTDNIQSYSDELLEQSSDSENVIAELKYEISSYQSELKDKPLSLFLSKLIIQQHPKLIQIYEDLQAFANFPLNTKNTRQPGFNQSAFDAWLEMTSYFSQIKRIEEESIAIAKKNAEMTAELVKLEQIPKLEQENNQVIAQLHQVQEQLEQVYLDNTSLKEQQITYKTKIEELDAAKVEALDNTQAELNKLQAELKKLDALPELKQENTMLLSQLHNVQEELERYYLENQAYKEAANTKPEDLEYTADQIKKQLPFRLGKVMIENHQSFFGMLFIGVLLLKEARACKQELLKTRQQKKILSKHERYLVEDVKGYLEYRLGFIFLDSLFNPLKWFTLPFKFRKEIKPHLQQKAKK